MSRVIVLLLGCSGGDAEHGDRAREPEDPRVDDADSDDSGSGESRVFVALSTNGGTSCALTDGGNLACWGRGDSGETSPPGGSFSAVTVGGEFVCGRGAAGSWQCWGDVAGLSDAPAGWASAPVLDAGYEHVCSLGSDGAVRCWGQDDDVHTPINDVPSTGPFAQLEVGAAVACGLDAAGQATCWGWSEWGADSAPHEAFSRLSSGAAYTCGVVAGSGAVSCWGQDLAGETEPPSQYTFSDVAAGGTTTCGVTADHATVRCWGQDHDIRLPNLEYVRVGMGYDFVCALDVDGQIHCSGGDNEYGQLDAPT